MDKTGRIAILDLSDYIARMENTINEMKTTVIKTDPNKKLNETVKNLIKDGFWPNGEKPKIINAAPNTPRLFGRLKDHKINMKIRPIVSKLESPTYPIEKYMKTIFEDILPASEHSLYSTIDFIRKFKNMHIDADDIILSFDIINLFPSIDTTEIMKIINNRIFEKFKDTKIAETLVRASNLIINECYFKFNNIIYKQTGGVPMGSPISGILAEIKLRDLEPTILKRHQASIKYWLRYVDDIFAVITGIDPCELLKDLNNIDDNLKFTMDIENDNILNFLDVKIIRCNNKENFETTIYRKPQSNIEIINHKCKTPFNYKIAAIRSYVNRAIEICSSSSLLEEEINFIQTIAQEAGYSKELPRKLVKQRIHALNSINPAQKQKSIYTFPIPFCRGIANIIKRKTNDFNINVPIKPNQNIFQRIRSDKDKLDIKETAGIYKIEFLREDNTPGCYIGMTKRKIKERIKEHIRNCKLSQESTALSQLNIEENISINFENPIKLAEFNNQNYAKIREAIEILKDNSCCNTMEHATIDRVWKDILKINSSSKINSEVK